MNARTTAVAVLAICAFSDLAAVPLLLDGDDVPSALGVVIAVLALTTAVAAVGVARSSAWGRPVALGTRAVDLIAAVPAIGAGAGAATSAAVVTVALSAVAIGLLLRVHAPAGRRTAHA